MSIKRYGVVDSAFDYFEESYDGEWVRYEDHALEVKRLHDSYKYPYDLGYLTAFYKIRKTVGDLLPKGEMGIRYHAFWLEVLDAIDKVREERS